MIERKMWAVGGGKGGVGKSVLTLSLGLWLANLDKKVIVVDADLGGANLNILLGIRYPNVTLESFVNREVENLDDVLIDTPHENLSLICGADDILGLANPKYTQKLRLLRHLNNLDADYILLDLGAGTSYNVLDFFLYAKGRIAVFSPQTTSLQNVYGFIKSSLLRLLRREFRQDQTLITLLTGFSSGTGEGKISSISELKQIVRQIDEEKYVRLCRTIDNFDIKMVSNMTKQKKDQKISEVLRVVSERYLDLHLTDFGFVPYDPEIETSVNKMVPFLLNNNKSKAAVSTYQIAYRMIQEVNPATSESIQAHISKSSMNTIPVTNF
ncbi:MAG: P-loop NTPase [Thermodesulfobacteriota bacterium]|nr:P-loop NTPase [Thermodesulfobacteriota bacterium]